MPRDLSACGRYAPHLFHQPLAFYTAVRLSDPDALAQIMAVDPYYVTQDNGAGSPLHFATTYKRLDMAHHLLNLGAEVNQRDGRGMTALHRSAFLAHIDGYIELYELLLSRGADPSILTNPSDDYLNPGERLAIDLVVDDGGETRGKIAALEKKYELTPKKRVPHKDIGDWLTLYDYGLDVVKSWPLDHDPQYPEVQLRIRKSQAREKTKIKKRAERDRILLEIDSSSSVLLPPATVTEDSSVAFLFPGQGSQVVGMLSQAKDIPQVKEMLAQAKSILGFDLIEICLNGPKESLDETKVAQPALLIAGLAAAAMYVGPSPSCYAGLSLGEYAALISAGCMSFEDGMKVVKVRSESMDTCARAGSQPHGMLSVVGLSDQVLMKICSSALDEVKKKDPSRQVICQISNYLFPAGRVVSGHLECLLIVEQQAKAKGALKTLSLAVAGGFHTPLMEPARQSLVKALSAIEIRPPLVPVVSNVTGLPFPSDPDEIRSLLARQLVEPVKWEETLRHIIMDKGKTRLVECGPGNQIKAMVRRMDQEVWRGFQNVQP